MTPETLWDSFIGSELAGVVFSTIRDAPTINIVTTIEGCLETYTVDGTVVATKSDNTIQFTEPGKAKLFSILIENLKTVWADYTRTNQLENEVVHTNTPRYVNSEFQPTPTK